MCTVQEANTRTRTEGEVRAGQMEARQGGHRSPWADSAGIADQIYTHGVSSTEWVVN